MCSKLWLPLGAVIDVVRPDGRAPAREGAPAAELTVVNRLELDALGDRTGFVCLTLGAEGAVLLDKPRLMSVDEIYCEAPLTGHLTFMKNHDVPGVIGHVGGVLGRNNINIANFSLGRRESPSRAGEPLEAIAVVSTDGAVPENVLAQLRENPAVRSARSVEFV